MIRTRKKAFIKHETLNVKQQRTVFESVGKNV